MNVLEKIQVVKNGLLEANLKKSGFNKFSNFNYYELADFLPTLIKLCNDNKLYTKVSFDNDIAKLVIKNSEKPEEVEEYTSPMRDLDLKGCNEIQALGGVETYQRRYLYMSAFDIVENDMFDATSGKKGANEKKEKADSKVENPLDIIFKSGKYAGKTMLEICSKDMHYIDWLIEKGSEDAKKAKELFLNSQIQISDEEMKDLEAV